MSIALVLKELGLWLADVITLLLNPKVWLIMVAVGSYGFLRGCEDEKQRFDEHVKLDEALGAAQLARTLSVNAQNKAFQEEVEHESTFELAGLLGDLGAADERLREHANRRILPVAGRGPDKPVQPSCSPGERDFLVAIYAGSTVCYGVEQLDQGIQRIVGRAIGRARGIAEPAVIAIDDARWWGEWGRKIGACKP